MARLIGFILLLTFTYNQGYSQDSDSTKTMHDIPIKINTKLKNLGILELGEKVVYKFEITNTSNKPLVIWHVSASCGCTTPNWTKKPIQPNETGIVKVKFESEEPGAFEKSVHVYTNFNDRPVKLVIQGQVVTSKAEKGFSKKDVQFNSQISN